MLCGILLGYETQKVVQIHSKTIGLFFRCIQLGIIVYIVGYVMIYERGYQQYDNAVSGVTAKLKGVAVTNESTLGVKVWDPSDYVIPPQQKAAFFVMTNLVMTPGQTLTKCEEHYDVRNSNCTKDSDCRAGIMLSKGNGQLTGKCVPSTRQKGRKVCEIFGWCETEDDSKMPKVALLQAAENFTVLLKNSIEFPAYKVKRRNILETMTDDYLKRCNHHPVEHPYCPIFRLGDIINFTKDNDSSIWNDGGQISIMIEWNCDLDKPESQCLPKYTFRRLDKVPNIGVAKGWNFRFAHHYMINMTSYRTLIKACGIQFFIESYGKGYKFNVITFTLNLGSGLALFGVATVLCDMIVLNITRKRNIYRSAKVDRFNAPSNDVESNNKIKNSQVECSTSNEETVLKSVKKKASMISMCPRNGGATSKNAELKNNKSYNKNNQYQFVDTSSVNRRLKYHQESKNSEKNNLAQYRFSRSYDSFHSNVPLTILESLTPLNPIACCSSNLNYSCENVVDGRKF